MHKVVAVLIAAVVVFGLSTLDATPVHSSGSHGPSKPSKPPVLCAPACGCPPPTPVPGCKPTFVCDIACPESID